MPEQEGRKLTHPRADAPEDEGDDEMLHLPDDAILVDLYVAGFREEDNAK